MIRNRNRARGRDTVKIKTRGVFADIKSCEKDYSVPIFDNCVYPIVKR